jgi:hypothetical protein
MKKLIFVLVCLTFFTISCLEEIICIDGKGQPVTERRNIKDFNELLNTTSLDVVYRKADSVSVSITAESNLMEHIVTSVSGGRLEIKTNPRNSCFNFRMRPVVMVTSPQLSSIEITGSGSIEADTLLAPAIELRSTASGNLYAVHVVTTGLKIGMTGSGDISILNTTCNETDFTLTGSGNLQISGKSEKGTMKVTGSGDIKSSDMIITTANETITGSGNIYTTVTNTLNAVISGSGNIYVKGNPVVNQTLTGSGRVIKQ